MDKPPARRRGFLKKMTAPGAAGVKGANGRFDMNKWCAIAVVAAACAGMTTPAVAQSALAGAWKVTEIAEPGKPPITAPQPGMIVFAKQHYSFIRINGTQPLPDYPSNDKATDAQKVAVFDALYLNAGTYTATMNTLATKSTVAKSAFAMAGAGNQFDYAIDGDKLVLTQKPQGTVIKFVRLE